MGERDVLMIAFFFPPTHVVGALRPALLARYLPEHGWRPTVLTVDRFGTRPATLTSPMPEADVRRAPFVDPVGWGIERLRRGRGRPALAATFTAEAGTPARARVLSWARQHLALGVMRWPDRAFPWLVPAVQQGLKVLRRKPEAVIFSTSPPPTAHLVAACLARLTGRPWIADLRDPWTSRSARGWPWQAAESALERRLLRGARRLVTVSGELAEHLAGYHGRAVDVITNGFDPATEDAAPRRPLARLTLTYTGTIYRPQQDPELLLGGLARLRAAGELPPGAVDLRFFGADLGDVPLLADRLGVADCVSICAWVSRAEALARQRESHALLLLDWTVPDGTGVLTYKVFEYLQARRPVLAVGPRTGTALHALLEETGAGCLCTTPGAVADRIAALLAEHRATGDVAFAARPEAIERYSARRLAGQLAALLGSVLGP